VTGSVRFDRAAEYYDRTRVTSEDVMARTVELLSAELGGRGRVLEIGVGTGLLALPLSAARLPVVGIDLSTPMVAKLVEKTGGRPPFPLVITDATRMPFPDGTFGGAYLRWVLHLIPDWRAAVAEAVRVVRRRGVIVVNHGGFSEMFRSIRARVEEFVGRRLPAAGLDWDGWAELADEMRRLGARHRELPPIPEHSEVPLAEAVEGLRANRYSWTWPLTETERLRAADELATWLEDRFGDLAAPHPDDASVVWHAYDLA
jgi:SAM-dependent methyltransferase